MLALCCSPAWWEHKARVARLTRNLIGGTAKITANHLDFFLKNNISTALRTINLDLHNDIQGYGSSKIKEASPHTRYKTWPPVVPDTRI